MTRPFAHPEALIARLEDHVAHDSRDPYWERLDALMHAALDRWGDPDQADDANILRQTTGGLALETAARHVGFILGLEYAQLFMKAGGVH
jgi:hypothetical protein